MKILKISVTFLLAILSSGILSAQGIEESTKKGLESINEAVLKAQLSFLASDWMEGRETGEKGEFLSADYIASMLQLYGVKPGGNFSQMRGIATASGPGGQSYFQNFSLLKTSPGDEQVLKVKWKDGEMLKTTNFTYNVDFTVRPSDPAIEIEAPVVFAGYGIKSDKLKYNDFNKLDLKGKFILRVTGSPEFIRKSLSATELSAATREIETIARDMGAIGIIEFNPESAVAGGATERKDFLNMSPSEGSPRSGKPQASYSIPTKKGQDNLIRVTISAKTANEIFKGTGIVLEDFLKKVNANELVTIPVFKGKNIYLKTTVKTSTVAVRNIIGIIEGEKKDQIVVIGAHYDHLGMGNGYLWNGADDNGSGTVAVMTIARAIMATGKKPQKTIILALWTAEEKGLLGSRYYVENLTYPLADLKLHLNFDMISRYVSDTEPKKVTMTYTSTQTGFKDLTENNLKKYGIDLIVDYQASPAPTGGSDHRSFVAAGVPIMRFKPGHREEYHTPGDEIRTINWDIMEKIIKISFANLWELSNSDR